MAHCSAGVRGWGVRVGMCQMQRSRRARVSGCGRRWEGLLCGLGEGSPGDGGGWMLGRSHWELAVYARSSCQRTCVREIGRRGAGAWPFLYGFFHYLTFVVCPEAKDSCKAGPTNVTETDTSEVVLSTHLSNGEASLYSECFSLVAILLSLANHCRH